MRAYGKDLPVSRDKVMDKMKKKENYQYLGLDHVIRIKHFEIPLKKMTEDVKEICSFLNELTQLSTVGRRPPSSSSMFLVLVYIQFHRFSWLFVSICLR